MHILTCPKCHQQAQLKKARMNRSVSCPNCHQIVPMNEQTISAPSSTPTAADPTAAAIGADQLDAANALSSRQRRAKKRRQPSAASKALTLLVLAAAVVAVGLLYAGFFNSPLPAPSPTLPVQ